MLKHSKGQTAGQPFLLLPWQKYVLGEIFGRLNKDGTRQYRQAYIEIPKKNGKALAIDTKVPTPSGWSLMGDLKVGDEVFGDDGLPCRIVAATDVMHGRECFEVAFGDGCKVIADADHEWVAYCHSEERERIFTTREMAAKPTCGKVNNFRVAVARPLFTPDADLPIDPYLLGAWLGDGATKDARISVGFKETEMLALLASRGTEITVSRANGAYLARPRDGFQKSLREHGLLGRKHIPAQYLRASIEQRLMLLRGMMDTDGYASRKGQCEYTTILPELRDGFVELVRSLGFKPTVLTADATLNGRVVGVRHRVIFSAFAGAGVFLLRRKEAQLPPRPNRAQRSASRSVVSVTRIPSTPVRCIQVDSRSSTFLCGESMIPTHNSTLLAGICLYALVADNEPGAEVYGAACDREQAGIIYREAASMVRASPALSRVLEVVDSRKTIIHRSSNSFYRVLSADSFRQEGLNIHACAFDEVHAQRGNRALWDALRYGGAARRQPLCPIGITTAGEMNTSHLWWDLHTYAEKCTADPAFDPTFFGAIFAADREDDWKEPATWYKANPSLGETISEESFRADCRAAENSATQLNAFLRYRLNIPTSSDVRWLRPDQIAACNGGPPEPLEGRDCWCGLDLASNFDTTAFVAVFPDDDGHFDVVAKFWIPEHNAEERARNDRVDYMRWAAEGQLTLTEGKSTDYKKVRADILEFASKHRIRKLAIDRWNATQLATELADDGLPVTMFGQGFASMSAPTKKIEGMFVDCKLRLAGNKPLNWQLGNAAVQTDPAGNVKVSKSKSSERVDGVVALVMAAGVHMGESMKPADLPEISFW